MGDIVPGVIVKHKFVIREQTVKNGKTVKPFKSYLDYTNREAAADKHKYAEMVGYMGNEMKTTNLFGPYSDHLSNDEKEAVKRVFDIAEEKGLPMWQTIISFDNEWLSENGLYDKNSDRVRAEKLIDYSRPFMAVIAKKEGLEPVWAAAIHYNTDNLHIHFAYVDINSKRERGKFKYGTIKAAKSAVVSRIIADQEENVMISQIMRGSILEKEKQSDLIRDYHLAEKMLILYDKLPKDHKTWKYGYNVMKPLRPLIDEISETFIDQFARDDYTELDQLLDKQALRYERAYGKSSTRYKQNRIKDLKERMGNTILKQLREYDKEKRKEMYRGRYKKSKQRYKKAKNMLPKNKIDVSIMRAVYTMKHLLRNDISSARNQRYYESMVEKEEKANSRDY